MSVVYIPNNNSVARTSWQHGCISKFHTKVKSEFNQTKLNIYTKIVASYLENV